MLLDGFGHVLDMYLPSIQRAGCLRLKSENRIGMEELQNMAPGYHQVSWDIIGSCDHMMSVSYFCVPEGPFDSCTTHGRATAGCETVVLVGLMAGMTTPMAYLLYLVVSY